MSRIRRDLGVVAINNKVTTNTSDISSHTSSIKTLNTTVSGHTTSISSINTDVTALKKRGWCTDGTELTSKKTSITTAGEQTITYTVKNDCYLGVYVHARDERAGQGAILGTTYVTLAIGNQTVLVQPENGDTEHDNFMFGLLVKAGATAKLTLNAYSPGADSYVNFVEFKLS